MSKRTISEVAVRFMPFIVARYVTGMRFVLLRIVAPILRLLSPLGNWKRKRVLYVGQCYYNTWYLSRALRKLGWDADVLNWDPSDASQKFYHGEDFRLSYSGNVGKHLRFYLWALCRYDVFHFSNKGGIQFGEYVSRFFSDILGSGFEIRFLKALGKKVVYTNNGCLDGVSQTAFRKWGPYPVCGICRWRDNPAVCSDERNLEWGAFRNEVADYQCLLGGNRADYNDAPTVHEVPEFYCLDSDMWHPNLDIPEQYRHPFSSDTILLYHAVGNYDARSDDDGVNIKSTHIYKPLVEELKADGHAVEMIFYTNVPNKEIRFYQAQADIFLEMLTYGWFGANAREAMMLGKPVVCFLRPEWLDSARKEIPEYIDELPIVVANPENIKDVLLDLITNKEKRHDIGRRSREFAMKWHSAEAGANRFDRIYSNLLGHNEES